MIGHTLRHGVLLRDILEGEVIKKRRSGMPTCGQGTQYFLQIVKDMGCENFREVAWDIVKSGDG